MIPSLWPEVRWVLAVLSLSWAIALGLKTIAPLYPLPPNLGVIMTLVLGPSIAMAVVLLVLNRSDNQTPAP